MEKFIQKYRYILLFILSTPFYIAWLINSPTIRSSLDVKMEVLNHYEKLEEDKEKYIQKEKKWDEERKEDSTGKCDITVY